MVNWMGTLYPFIVKKTTDSTIMLIESKVQKNHSFFSLSIFNEECQIFYFYLIFKTNFKINEKKQNKSLWFSLKKKKEAKIHNNLHFLFFFFATRFQNKINQFFKFKGTEIEDSKEPMNGKMWVCYINKNKEDWDVMVENDQKVTHKDIIQWKYENLK